MKETLVRATSAMIEVHERFLTNCIKLRKRTIGCKYNGSEAVPEAHVIEVCAIVEWIILLVW